MSCSLYRWTEECDGQECPGDCDLCPKADEQEEGDDVRIMQEQTDDNTDRS